MKKEYLFVVVYEPTGFKKGDPVAFKHVFVQANNGPDAYNEGQRILIDGKRIKGVPLNDYVVNLSTKRSS